MFKNLEGKTAVITGGTEGIGLAAANFSSKRVPMCSSPAAGRRNSTTP
jgi:short-subunit dehydrogenase involved in D-alanine esterification of teichoic acids